LLTVVRHECRIPRSLVVTINKKILVKDSLRGISQGCLTRDSRIMKIKSIRSHPAHYEEDLMILAKNVK